MEAYEAIKVLMPRIQKIDPENASKIMCSILMKDGGGKEMVRLAFVSDAALLSYINQVKTEGLGVVVSSDGSCSTPNPCSSPSIRLNNSSYPHGSPSIMIPNNPKPISYADVLSGNATLSGSPSLPFYGSGDELFNNGQDQLPFVDETMRDHPIVSPSGRSDSLIFPYGEDMNNTSIHSPQPFSFHRRSFSFNDAAYLSNFEEGVGGFGWKPCVYYARGFCKNGSSCKFIHGDIGCGELNEIGSSSSGFDELLRFKALQQQQQQQQQQKLAFLPSGGHHPFHYNKSLNFLTGNHRNDFSPMALRHGESSSLHQIYLTFPADSTFKEEDVFRYFSKFGPVQDVRIPYQQKRMFGFVTFFYPETVKHILTKGNPHFVCESRVLVKPYKEKGKVAEKKQPQQQHYSDRAEYSACLSPSGIDSCELADLPIGPRMLFNTQEMMRRKKLEQEMELRQTMELQGRRLMNLQIMDQENQQLNNRFLPSLSMSVPVSSSLQTQLFMSPRTTYHDVLQEFDNGQEAIKSLSMAAKETESLGNNMVNAINHLHFSNPDSYFPESFEHALPDNLFASPTKSAAENKSIFSNTSAEDTTPVTNTSSNNANDLASNSLLGTTSQTSH